MSFLAVRGVLLGIGLGFLASAGCSQGPSRIKPLTVDPAGAAAKALETYDKDGDGALAGKELDASPGLKAAIAEIDSNQDKKLSQEEIQARMEYWIESKFGITQTSVMVTLNGAPLPGATVKFVPEEFLGTAAAPAEGVTDEQGVCSPSVGTEHMPEPGLGGLRLGFYRIEVSRENKGKEMVPAKYNTKTELGQEIATGAAKMRQGLLTFALRR
jgi:hypothetical protein